jgi:hypothetical protein
LPGRPTGVTLQTMPDAGEPRRLELEVRFDAHPIRGRLYEDPGRLDRPFSGWLGLMAALEAARSSNPRSQETEGAEG